MRYKVPALPQAGPARRTASRRDGKTQRRRATAFVRQLAGSTASERMLVHSERAWFSPENHRADLLKQDIKRITDSFSACLAHHSATEALQPHFLVRKRTTRASQSAKAVALRAEQCRVIRSREGAQAQRALKRGWMPPCESRKSRARAPLPPGRPHPGAAGSGAEMLAWLQVLVGVARF
jgi:hypothetical protein